MVTCEGWSAAGKLPPVMLKARRRSSGERKPGVAATVAVRRGALGSSPLGADPDGSVMALSSTWVAPASVRVRALGLDVQ